MDSSIDQFKKYRIPTEIEDEILVVFSHHINEDGDLLQNTLSGFFQELQLDSDLVALIDTDRLLIDDTKVVDFDLLMKQIGYILIYMNNLDIIDQYWSLLIKNSGKAEPQQHMTSDRNCKFYVKDLQKIVNVVGGQFNIIDLITVANNGERTYITYLDFAVVLGKLGYLKY